MFWNRIKIGTDRFGVRKILTFEGFRILTETDHRELHDKFRSVEQKLNLILDHLKLRYVPEKETTEPAKLEEKLVVSSGNINGFIEDIKILMDDSFPSIHIPTPKKKRKYVKSGKYKK